MNVQQLRPQTTEQQRFGLRWVARIPTVGGCYALATLDGRVLYVGLATSLKGRCSAHLNDPIKCSATPDGRAYWFHYLLETDAARRNQIERGWLVLSVQHDGRYPCLNTVSSPVG